MTSLINALQSFIEWIYTSVQEVVDSFTKIIGFVTSFYTDWYLPVQNVVLPVWLQGLLALAFFTVVGFLVLRLIVELL